MACRRAMVDAHKVGGISLLLSVRIWGEEVAYDAIAAGAVGGLDNIEGSGLISVAWSLREHWTWEGKKTRFETNGGIDENN